VIRSNDANHVVLVTDQVLQRSRVFSLQDKRDFEGWFMKSLLKVLGGVVMLIEISVRVGMRPARLRTGGGTGNDGHFFGLELSKKPGD
jgi:small-conductance mechanosensitive channel